MMRYSILTPTLCRPTLKRLCDSIDAQSSSDWEHIVIIDCDPTSEQGVILESIAHPQRRIIKCSKKHKMDYGNTARREGFDIAQGEYILQIDDDDWYADTEVFKTLERVTKTWAAFPVLSRGRRCHNKPPALHLTGSAMFMYRRDTGLKFPDNTDYSADGQLVEQLKAKFDYETLDDCRELVIYPKANHGRTQAEIDAWRPTHRGIKYAADGCTIDWHDHNTRG
jgi:glycosyltransferase involved in cell wall biosynthesis